MVYLNIKKLVAINNLERNILNLHRNVIINIQGNFIVNFHRNYSTLNSSSNDIPNPIETFINLNDIDSINLYRKTLKNKSGIYCFINTINNKKYIGNAKDLYLRLIEHLKNKKSNTALQEAFKKYGLKNFNFCVFEYFTYINKTLSSKDLTDLETSYIKRFDFNTLYNFKSTATSSLGYKHTKEAKLKMRN
jgi:hypothetical protein